MLAIQNSLSVLAKQIYNCNVIVAGGDIIFCDYITVTELLRHRYGVLYTSCWCPDHRDLELCSAIYEVIKRLDTSLKVYLSNRIV